MLYNVVFVSAAQQSESAISKEILGKRTNLKTRTDHFQFQCINDLFSTKELHVTSMFQVVTSQKEC